MKADAVASVMMKPLMPVRAIKQPVDQPGQRADRQREGDRERRPAGRDLHRAAEGDRHQAADRADRDVHLADAQRDHLREGDEQADAEARSIT